MKLAVSALLASLLSAQALAADSIFVSFNVTDKTSGKVLHKSAAPIANGGTLPYRDVELRRYRKTVTTSGSKVTVTPGVYEDGFKMDLSPRVLSTGEIHVQVHAELHDLERFDEPTGKDGIEVPIAKMFEAAQSLNVASGGTVEVALGNCLPSDCRYVLELTATKMD